jgi:TonB family protein
MQRFRPFALVALSSLIVNPALAAPPVPETLEPSSKWNANYADDSCRLMRAFGTVDGMTVVIFDRFAPSPSFKLTLAGKRFRHLVSGSAASLRFGPNEAEQKRDYFTGDYGKDVPALVLRGDMRFDKLPERARKTAHDIQAEDPPLDAARLAAINELIVGRPLARPVRLELGSMKAPVAAFDKCIDNLLMNWGIDVARHATLSRRALPTGNPASWLDSSDYPASAIFRGAQGIVNFRLSVDAAGVPTGCHIQQSSRPPEFDKTVCTAMMRRARFTPALDRDGKPLASYFRGTVVFKMG